MMPSVGQKCVYRDCFGFWNLDGEVFSVDEETERFFVSSQSLSSVPPQYNDSITVFYLSDIGKAVVFMEGLENAT